MQILYDNDNCRDSLRVSDKQSRACPRHVGTTLINMAPQYRFCRRNIYLRCPALSGSRRQLRCGCEARSYATANTWATIPTTVPWTIPSTIPPNNQGLYRSICHFPHDELCI